MLAKQLWASSLFACNLITDCLISFVACMRACLHVFLVPVHALEATLNPRSNIKKDAHSCSACFFCDVEDVRHVLNVSCKRLHLT
jgi:hypothetical protein